MANEIHLGDTVTGTYYDVAFTGIARAYDASGYLYVSFPVPFAHPVVCGIPRDHIALDGYQRASVRTVHRPGVAPAVELAPTHVLGGAYLV